jgi:outer membrane lipoprotein-sorting protein
MNRRDIMKAKMLKYCITLLSLSIGLINPIHSQEKREIELTAQEILARVDRVMDYQMGRFKGKMMHILPDGRSFLINFVASISESDYLFKFSSSGRGEELRVLYNFRGEDIWVYNIHAIRLFHKIGIDKYDPVLSTNFSFIDFSNADLQSNYTAAITGEAIVKGYEAYRLTLNPIFKGGNYGLLTLYANKENFVPLRIDYHDSDKVIFKTMSIAKTMVKGKSVIPVRYDMLDIRKGTVTILNFHGFEKNMSFDRKIFRHQTLGE